jgi:hypothetical protein
LFAFVSLTRVITNMSCRCYFPLLIFPLRCRLDKTMRSKTLGYTLNSVPLFEKLDITLSFTFILATCAQSFSHDWLFSQYSLANLELWQPRKHSAELVSSNDVNSPHGLTFNTLRQKSKAYLGLDHTWQKTKTRRLWICRKPSKRIM